MAKIDTEAPVLVTGATGYVAGWIVKVLLDRGLTVHAAVRDPDDKKKLEHLDKLQQGSSGKIRYFKSDLLNDGSYAEAMQGCELVFHTASPFTTSVNDPQKQLVDPAVKGTRNVLEQANRTPSVKRVVLTSSIAAIYGDAIDLEKTKTGRFTEEDWNETSSLSHQPYSYSKTMAEREAWKIAKAQGRWDLVVINPTLVIGPGINPKSTSESFSLIKQLGDGSMKTGLPNFTIAVVDVRDVAQAHVNAGFKADASGRYIISAHDTSFPDLSQTLVKKYGNAYPFPRRVLPKWLVWLVGPLIEKSLTRRMVSRNVDYPFRCDNQKGVRELGMTYRSLDVSMGEFFQQMIDNKLV
jgi:nucleoside-diphosphate-sugar epimerase